MMNKKKLLIAYLFVCNPLVMLAISPSTPAVVELFYGTMKKITGADSDANAYDYREQLKDCFRGKKDSGIPVPNDFFEWGYKTDSKITANQYANMFYELSYQKKALRIEKYTIGKSHYVNEADLKQYRNQSSGLIQTVITKTFTNGRITRTFSDTLIVERNEIVFFKNAISVDDGEDIEALRAIAASYYTSKRYYDAYRTYQKIIKIDSKNANAYYRLGVMTYYREGCWFSSKEATRKAIEYVENAKALGFNSDKTSKTIYYMKHPQSI